MRFQYEVEGPKSRSQFDSEKKASLSESDAESRFRPRQYTKTITGNLFNKTSLNPERERRKYAVVLDSIGFPLFMFVFVLLIMELGILVTRYQRRDTVGDVVVPFFLSVSFCFLVVSSSSTFSFPFLFPLSL